MFTFLTLFAALLITLLASAIRYVPAGQVYSLYRLGKPVRLLQAGTHLVLPLLDRVMHKINLAGQTLRFEELLADAHDVRGTVYWQVLEPERADAVIEQIDQLIRRGAKEALLSAKAPESVPIVVPSRGSKLIGGSIRTEVTQDELVQTLLEGFFPTAAVSDVPQSRARGALTQLGLPYAQDAAVTRHLAAFLSRQRGATAEIEGFDNAAADSASFLHPTAVLFNGGVLKSQLIAERLLDILNSWLEAEGAAPARLLGGADLDLAVARGAAYYGYVRRGQGVRIRGGTARAYYVAVESSMPAIPGMAPPIQALCLAPFGMEEGTEVDVQTQEFGLVVGEPVQLRFFGSSVRRQDPVGALLDFWQPDELQELGDIQATLPAEGRQPGDVVQVRLRALATDTGTLELTAVATQGGEHWKVEFDVRSNA